MIQPGSNESVEYAWRREAQEIPLRGLQRAEPIQLHDRCRRADGGQRIHALAHGVNIVNTAELELAVLIVLDLLGASAFELVAGRRQLGACIDDDQLRVSNASAANRLRNDGGRCEWRAVQGRQRCSHPRGPHQRTNACAAALTWAENTALNDTGSGRADCHEMGA